MTTSSLTTASTTAQTTTSATAPTTTSPTEPIAEAADSTAQLSPEQLRGEQHWKKQFTKEELREILAFEDWRSIRSLIVNWGIVFAAFALVGWSANPITILLALFLLGGRQLGCSIIMHEAAHRSFLSNRKWNDLIGNWFGAYPVWSDVGPYRSYHLLHHAKTGTPADPDLSLTLPFPISKQSFRRKVWRDLSGQTGWKQLVGTFKRDVGIGTGMNQRNQGLKKGEAPDVGWHKLLPVVLSNGVLFGILALFGRPELYLLWPIALLTTFRLAIRIRSIAEHAMAGPADDPLRNTRTTLVSWWERIFFAPNFVNYHLEHHLLMTVPHYHLPKMHKLLRERGLLEKALVNDGGYREVLTRAASA